VSWDTPQITPEGKNRYDACVTVSEELVPDGNIGIQHLPGGRCAVYQREVADKQFKDPWIELMRDWLPVSGYQPDDRPTLEIFRNNAAEHPEQKWVVDFCLPVKPL
jgi:AraC family transcriptional regulator